MIVNFKCKETEKLWKGEFPKRIPREILTRALNKLTILNAFEKLEDLKSPPANKLESLKGDRKGQYSIRINNQWRICFKIKEKDVIEVEIVDYH